MPLLVGPAPGLAQAEGIGWQEAVARLAHERTRAETCVRLLKTCGDEVTLSRGDLTYGEAKAEIDAVIAGLVVALAKDEEPATLPISRLASSSASKAARPCASSQVAGARHHWREERHRRLGGGGFESARGATCPRTA